MLEPDPISPAEITVAILIVAFFIFLVTTYRIEFL